MAPTIQRPLQLWEQVGSTINISMYLELQGHGVTSATVSHALKALQTQHPFLRMGIEYQENVATLIELPSSALIPSAKAGLYPKWQARLQELANEFKDLAEGVMSVDFASDGEQHQLFLTLNHAGGSAPHFYHKNPSIFPSAALSWFGGVAWTLFDVRGPSSLTICSCRK